MNFFEAKTTWKNLEFIPLKLCVAFAYLLVGAYFHRFIREHYLLFIILFFIALIWALYLWITKMRDHGRA